jgi:hypothetical protein
MKPRACFIDTDPAVDASITYQFPELSTSLSLDQIVKGREDCSGNHFRAHYTLGKDIVE